MSTVEITVIVKIATAKAVLVDHGGKEDVWVPISQITDWCEGPDDKPGLGTTSIFIPEWLATEKGML
jgi:hypothetical protein